MNELIIWGMASQKVVKKIQIPNHDDLKNQKTDISLMVFLQNNGLPIASSCAGEGICKKCVAILDGLPILTCQHFVYKLFENKNSITLQISYL